MDSRIINNPRQLRVTATPKITDVNFIAELSAQ